MKRPRWVYDDGVAVDFTMELPQRAWDFESRGEGGQDVSAAGIPVAYEIRRDQVLHLSLRFREEEWPDVERLVRHLQRDGSATFYPDQADAGTSHAVYGEAPAIGEEIRPRRGSEPSTLELDMSVRRTTSVVFEDGYFLEPA